MEIDLRPELYKHYHLRAVPEKYRDQVDVRAFGTGERIVFLPYTREVFAATQQWTEAHDLFSGPSPLGRLRRGRPGLIPNGPGESRYLTLIRVPSSAPSQISRITPAAATSNTCMVRDCSLASTNALVSMMRTPVASASS